MSPEEKLESADGADAMTSNREIVITRVFDAPRPLVFDAFTEADRVVQWWGPNGFTTTIHEMEVKPGGVWRFTMHGPDGVDYGNRIVYREIEKPERLVFMHGGDNEDEVGLVEVTITFTEEAGKTRVTLRQLYDTAAQRDESAKYAIEGGNQTMDCLARYLEGAS